MVELMITIKHAYRLAIRGVVGVVETSKLWRLGMMLQMRKTTTKATAIFKTNVAPAPTHHPHTATPHRKMCLVVE
jgi:hypothetical protein